MVAVHIREEVGETRLLEARLGAAALTGSAHFLGYAGDEVRRGKGWTIGLAPPLAIAAQHTQTHAHTRTHARTHALGTAPHTLHIRAQRRLQLARDGCLRRE